MTVVMHDARTITATYLPRLTALLGHRMSKDDDPNLQAGSRHACVAASRCRQAEAFDQRELVSVRAASIAIDDTTAIARCLGVALTVRSRWGSSCPC